MKPADIRRMPLLTPTWAMLYILIGLCCFLILCTRRSRASRLINPPGPSPSNWITGNLNELLEASEAPWVKFTEWSQRYGDIVYFRVLHKRSLVVNSLKMANELFDKRSNIYSSRPSIAMSKLMGCDDLLALIPYGARWRSQRRLFQEFFNPDASRSYHTVQTNKVHELLSNLLDNPDAFLDRIRHFTGALIMSLLYDHDAKPQNDRFLEIATATIDKVERGLSFGLFLVNSLPILQFVPEWLPGAYFKRYARETRALVERMLNEPLQDLQQRIVEGTAKSCIASNALESHEAGKQAEDLLGMCSSTFAAGADTTMAVLRVFFLAMVKNPHIQARAQAELDAVIMRGTNDVNRLPTLEDRRNLPYIEALVRETLRWHPILPLSIPHYTTEDDMWVGWRIPKGTTVIPNVWAMSRDPAKYDKVDLFDPSRFLVERVGEHAQVNICLNDDDVGYVFGFGRRICPGRHLAMSTLWLTIASVLTVFDIRRKDESRREVEGDNEFVGVLLSQPVPFECSIIPRSEAARCFLMDMATERNNI